MMCPAQKTPPFPSRPNPVFQSRLPVCLKGCKLTPSHRTSGEQDPGLRKSPTQYQAAPTLHSSCPLTLASSHFG